MDEIIEGNDLIRKYIEMEYYDDFNYPEENEAGWYNSDGICMRKVLKFHSSWDWLMPVIEEIEMYTIYSLVLDYDNREEFKGWSANWSTLNSKDEILGYIENKKFNTKIEAAWFALVEFIKWYNTNKNKTE